MDQCAAAFRETVSTQAPSTSTILGAQRKKITFTGHRVTSGHVQSDPYFIRWPSKYVFAVYRSIVLKLTPHGLNDECIAPLRALTAEVNSWTSGGHRVPSGSDHGYRLKYFPLHLEEPFQRQNVPINPDMVHTKRSDRQRSPSDLRSRTNLHYSLWKNGGYRITFSQNDLEKPFQHQRLPCELYLVHNERIDLYQSPCDLRSPTKWPIFYKTTFQIRIRCLSVDCLKTLHQMVEMMIVLHHVKSACSWGQWFDLGRSQRALGVRSRVPS